MPKIEAANIEEHIRNQTDRILNAATGLFLSKGYRGTDMGDIARSIGLARNSLYRYYASKDHILVASLQRDMAPFIEEVLGLEKKFPDPAIRIDAWLELQMNLATGPCRTAMNWIGDIGEASSELRKEIGILHEPPHRVLETAVTECLAHTGRDVKVVTAMIASMVQSAGAQIIKGGGQTAVLEELKRSVEKVLRD
jgi:AcrR family transcriptional regulator